jgi:hypothetical protein
MRLLLAAALALSAFAVAAPAAQACTGAPCDLECDVYRSQAYQLLLGDHPCPR